MSEHVAQTGAVGERAPADWWIATPTPETREYVAAELTRFSTLRFQKENLANASVVLWLAALGAVLGTNELPFAKLGWLFAAFVSIFLWSLAYVVLRLFLNLQLRRYRWAVCRQAGCDWLLFSWIEGAQIRDASKNRTNWWWHKRSDREKIRRRYQVPSDKPRRRKLREILWVDEVQVAPIDPRLEVYPQFLEQAWMKAAKRGSDSAIDEKTYKWITLVVFILGLATIFLKSNQPFFPRVSPPSQQVAPVYPEPS